jgi:hypothetical protein
MELLAAIRAEYQRYRRLVELAISQVKDADLSRRPCPDGNSIAIVQLARTYARDAWQSLTIPRGGSDAYAQNPTRERGPG